MSRAKDLIVMPVSAKDASLLVKKVHYSGKVVQNSQLHLGVFLNGKMEGAMQFGPSLDKRRMQGLVANTKWNGFIELNRMAFSDALPRNSESRALSVAFRMIKKAYPHIEWIVSFSDGAQCGDGTIYRASGFVLTGIKKNNSIWEAPSGESFSRTSLTDHSSINQKNKAKMVISRTTVTKGAHAMSQGGGASMRLYKDAGFKPIEGFQIRYVKFLNEDAINRLTVPILPFSKIDEMGAGMYRGEKITRTKKQDAENPSALGGALPTRALQKQSDAQ